MVIKAEKAKVFTLHQQIATRMPVATYEQIVTFLTDDPEQMEVLFSTFQAGRIDPLIIETEIPEEVFDAKHREFKVVSMTDPEGNDVLSIYLPEKNEL